MTCLPSASAYFTRQTVPRLPRYSITAASLGIVVLGLFRPNRERVVERLRSQPAEHMKDRDISRMADQVSQDPRDPDSIRAALDAIAAVKGGQQNDPTQGPHGQVAALVEALLVDPDNLEVRLYNTISAYTAVGSSLATIAATALEIDELEVLARVDKAYEDARRGLGPDA
jgi:hypothetical protein